MKAEPPASPSAERLEALPTIDPSQLPQLDDSLSVREAAALSGGLDLEAAGKFKEHRRHQQFRDHVNLAALILLWLVVVGVSVGMIIFLWHLFLPEALHWMSPAALDQLKTLLGAVLLSSALTNYAKQRMEA